MQTPDASSNSPREESLHETRSATNVLQAPRRSPAGPAAQLRAGAALLLLALVAYVPVTRNGYIWDDDAYVTQNLTLRSPAGLWKIWFVPLSLPQYYPLVHSTFWIEYHLWGLAPLGYHVVNVLLHMVSILLFWRLLVRLELPGAWLAAAIFTVHPVHVESVAWVTERKNVLSLALALGSLLAYLRFSPATATRDDANSEATAQNWRWYAAAYGLFVAALLSKSVVASLPAVILVIYWWKRGAIGWREVAPLIPFFVVGIAAGAHTAWLERYNVGAQGTEWNFSFLDRVLIAGRVAWFYAAKLAWPDPLMFFYPRWEIDDHVWWQYLFPLSAAALIAALWYWRGAIGRGPLAAILIFGGVLVPVLGFLNVYPFRFSFVADHFDYHASLALLALFAAVATLVLRHLAGTSSDLARFAGAALVLLLIVLSWRRVTAFQDPETLYRDTLAKNPGSVISLANLALYLADQGRCEEALPLAREGVRLGPQEAAAHNNLGLVLLRSGDRLGFQPGQFDEAVAQLQECLRINPRYAAAHSNLAYTLLTRGKAEEALQHFTSVLEIEPANARAMYGCATCLEMSGKLDDALDFYARSVVADPDLAPAHFKLAQLLLDREQVDDAIQHLQAGLSRDPANIEAHMLLGNALLRRGDLQAAGQEFAAVLNAQPRHPSALTGLGLVLLQARQPGQAIRYLEEALRFDPQNAQARALLEQARGQASGEK